MGVGWSPKFDGPSGGTEGDASGSAADPLRSRLCDGLIRAAVILYMQLIGGECGHRFFERLLFLRPLQSYSLRSAITSNDRFVAGIIRRISPQSNNCLSSRAIGCVAGIRAWRHLSVGGRV